MLINKGIAAGEIVTIKTTSGEELVAKLVEDTPTGTIVSRPLVLTANAKGQPILAPFLFTIDEKTDVTILKSAVMILAPTVDDVVKTYHEQTTTINLLK